MVIPQTVEQLDLAVWPLLYTATKRGLLVDRERLKTLQTRVEAEMETALARLESLTGKSINPNSGVQVAAWMEDEGLSGKLTRGKDRLSTSERDLKLHVNPVIDSVLEYRGLSKLKSAFILPTLGYSAFDGRIHPKWKPTRVASGRLACGKEGAVKTYSLWDSPNLMAFPTRDEIGREMRRCFIADPGYTYFSIDFSQIEPRLAAAISKDPELLTIYREGRDIYTEVARKLFGVEKVDKQLHRLPAKIVTLGVFYGMGERKLYEELLRWGCGTPEKPLFDIEACGGLIEKWFETYAGVAALVDQTLAEARRAGGWASTALGRRRFLPALFLPGMRYPESKLREEAERQVFNHLIQGTAQEQMKFAMLRVWPAAQRREFEPLLQIHDELVGQTLFPETVKTLANTMQTVYDGVDLLTEWTTGDSWGSLKG